MNRQRTRGFRFARPLAVALLVIHVGGLPAPAQLPPAPPTPARLIVVERVLAQDQGDWQVDYSLKNAGAAPLVLPPAEVYARIEGWLSNSKVAAHATPRRSECTIDGASSPSGFAEVVASADESARCRERAVIQLRTGKSAESTPRRGGDPEPLATLTVEPGGLLRVRLRLEHQHCLYGEYDPLLGRRELELRLGSSTVRDVLPLDREQYQALPQDTWPEPSEDHRDTRQYLSGPDSLHLEADVPGNQYYRFPERKVRYSTRMRLKFWYLIAPGTEGEFKARIAQYRESPNSWKPLSDGASEHSFATAGRWILFERIIKTEPEATTLALDFRIANAEVGEVWVDDVSLTPVDALAKGP
ncbi:hypothetical protein P12x_005779 [Tundrisphaera lichenicola]|uniref:hypothetical protein n=1 Tax=Tundrisphaera lichenicola TaxID=2029860 RepID=UPI003EB7001C